MRKTVFFAMMAALLSACGPEPDMAMRDRQREQTSQAAPVRAVDQPRVSVERIGVFRDDLAYGSRRGVYVIRDAETGREFIGLSGVGIAEVGSHSNGKTSTRDER